MKPKTMVLILLAVTCGLGAAYTTSRLLSDREANNDERVTVLVAKKNLDTGLIIKKPEDLFEEKQIPKTEDMAKNLISTFDALKGRQLRIPRRKGDTITDDELVDKNAPGIATHLPEGYRAVGQRVNMESIASGFAALPLSRVDVMHTVRRGSAKESRAQILLENVLVLAADTQTIRDEQGKPMPASIVTFALTPEDALKLDIARQSGSISLALRKYGENTKIGPISVTEDQAVNNRGSGKPKTDDEDTPENSTKSTAKAGDLPAIPAGNGPVAPALEQKKERGFIMRITNGDLIERLEFNYDAEDNAWISRVGSPPQAAEERPTEPANKK